MKLIETRDRVNAELRNRHAAGRSTDIVDYEFKPMVDDNVGVFVRNKYHFADGDTLVIDSMEMSPELRKALQDKMQ